MSRLFSLDRIPKRVVLCPKLSFNAQVLKAVEDGAELKRIFTAIERICTGIGTEGWHNPVCFVDNGVQTASIRYDGDWTILYEEDDRIHPGSTFVTLVSIGKIRAKQRR